MPLSIFLQSLGWLKTFVSSPEAPSLTSSTKSLLVFNWGLLLVFGDLRLVAGFLTCLLQNVRLTNIFCWDRPLGQRPAGSCLPCLVAELTTLIILMSTVDSWLFMLMSIWTVNNSWLFILTSTWIDFLRDTAQYTLWRWNVQFNFMEVDVRLLFRAALHLYCIIHD